MCIEFRLRLVERKARKNLGSQWYHGASVSVCTPNATKILISLYECMLSHFSRVQLFATLWTVAHQVPLSVGFPRQEYWSGLPCSSLGDLSDPGIKSKPPAWQADSLPLLHLESPSPSKNLHIIRITQRKYINIKNLQVSPQDKYFKRTQILWG